MPVIQRFNGFVIRMYFADHNPPHVHVVRTDFEAWVSIGDQIVFEGEIPARFRREALDWIAANAEMLMTEWERMH